MALLFSVQASSLCALSSQDSPIDKYVLIADSVSTDNVGSIVVDLMFDHKEEETLPREEKIKAYSLFSSEKAESLENMGFKATYISHAVSMPIVSLHYRNVYLDTVTSDLKKNLRCDDLLSISIREDANYEPIQPNYQENMVVNHQRSTNDSWVDYRDIQYDNYEATTYSGYGVKIGVADLGQIYITHSNFADTNFVIDSSNVKTSASNIGHGDMVLSVLTGKYGLAPRASIYYVDATDPQYSGYKYLDYFATQTVDVINLSVSSSGLDSCKYINWIVDNYHIPIVASCVNNLSSNLGQPACAQNVISVCSINPDYTIASGTNIRDPNDSVENNFRIAATGGLRQVNVYGNDLTISGTSLATPAVTGTIALMMEKNPNMKGDVALVMAALGNGADNTLIAHNSNSSVTDSYDSSSGLYSWSGVGALDIKQSLWIAGFAATPTFEVSQGNEAYLFDVGNAQVGQRLYTTHAWLQRITRYHLYANVYQFTSSPLPNLNLRLYNSNGVIVWQTTCSNTNIERHFYTFTANGNYVMKVYCASSSYTVYSPSSHYSVACHRAI